jgi:K(+)-stimulated pyrophosphate-energized sodium pump
MEGTGKPEYDKCVDISTKASLKEMMLPGLLTIGFPIAIVLLGKLVYPENNLLIAEMLGGYMAGVTVSGVLWAIFQNNAGGAWDNAKKSFEAGVEINGEMTFKGSDAHKAAVTGDTVGDPFKDTSGPSMNILIKLTCLIGLVIAPILGDGHNLNQNKVMNNSEVKECSADCKMPCCSTYPDKDLTINIDVNQTSSGSDSLASVLVTSLKDGDTLTNKENNITGENPNMDSIVKAEKSSAND